MIISLKNGLARRDFLIDCGQTALLLGPALYATAYNSRTPYGEAAEFHLHPHYRERSPLEVVLNKRRAALDDFVAEKYHDQIAVILEQWSANLLQASNRTQAIQNVLANDFRGCLTAAFGIQVAAPEDCFGSSAIEFRKASRPSDARRSPRQLRQYWLIFRKVLNCRVSDQEDRANHGNGLLTVVRYDLVGTGDDFFREQRTGHWELPGAQSLRPISASGVAGGRVKLEAALPRRSSRTSPDMRWATTIRPIRHNFCTVLTSGEPF